MMFPGLQGGNRLNFGGMLPQSTAMPVRGTMGTMGTMGPIAGNNLNLGAMVNPQPQPMPARPGPFMPQPVAAPVQGTMAGAPQGQPMPAHGTMLPYSQPYIPPFMMPPRRMF